jgi:hypothetical protein
MPRRIRGLLVPCIAFAVFVMLASFEFQLLPQAHGKAHQAVEHVRHTTTRAGARQPCFASFSDGSEVLDARRPPSEVEAVLITAFGCKVEVLVGTVQRLAVPRSSEYPAFRRDWGMGRPPGHIDTGGQSGAPPLVRVMEHCCGQPVGESSHVSCRP